VGCEIYYGNRHEYGKGWASHISNRWNRERIVDLLKGFSFLDYQEADTQRDYKISYYMKPGKDRLSMIHDRLLNHRCRYNLIYSHDRYLDILPYRASKGKAIRYLSYKWEIPRRNFLVCGDSGNDEEMLRGESRAVVVANYSHELRRLRGGRNIFFAGSCCAGGIIEGMQHYRFIQESNGG
jgi:sucrose-phosphate synthase